MKNHFIISKIFLIAIITYSNTIFSNSANPGHYTESDTLSTKLKKSIEMFENVKLNHQTLTNKMPKNLLSIFNEIENQVEKNYQNSTNDNIEFNSTSYSFKFKGILQNNSSVRKQLVNSVSELQGDLADYFINCAKPEMSEKSNAIRNKLENLHFKYREIEGLQKASSDESEINKTENLIEKFDKYLMLINAKISEKPKPPLIIIKAYIKFFKDKMSDKLLEIYESKSANANSTAQEYLDLINQNTKTCKDKENPKIDYVQENEKICLGEKFYEQVKLIKDNKAQLIAFLVKQSEESIPVAFDPRMPVTVFELAKNKCNPEKNICNVFVQCKGNTNEDIGVTQQSASCDCDHLRDSDLTEQLYNTDYIKDFSTKNKLALLCILDQTLGRINSKNEGIVSDVQFNLNQQNKKPIEFNQVKGQSI